MQAMKLWRAAYKICPHLEEPTWKSNGARYTQASIVQLIATGGLLHSYALMSILMSTDGGKSWSQM